MKRIYAMLGPAGVKLRNILEFDGGVTDSYLSSAKQGIDVWNVVHLGQKPRYRIPPASQPQPRLPNQATPDRNYDIGYFTRDVRRNRDPALNVPIEQSFSSEAAKLLEGPKIDAAAPPPGSNVGQKNPDVLRYDPTGLRSTMSASLTAMNKALAAHRPNHLPSHLPGRKPVVKRMNAWSQVHVVDEGTPPTSQRPQQ